MKLRSPFLLAGTLHRSIHIISMAAPRKGIYKISNSVNILLNPFPRRTVQVNCTGTYHVSNFKELFISDYHVMFNLTGGRYKLIFRNVQLFYSIVYSPCSEDQILTLEECPSKTKQFRSNPS